MAAQNNAQTIALQLEKVRDKVPLLYERDDVLLSMIQQRGDVEKVSSRNMRLPLQLIPGGKAGSYSADGGDLGRGSGTTYDVAQVSPIFFRFAVEITKLVEYASNSREKGHRKCREAGNRQRHEAIPLVPRQGDSDRRERRAGNDQRDQRLDVHDGHAHGRGARVCGADDPDLRSDAYHQPQRRGQRGFQRHRRPIRFPRRKPSPWTTCRAARPSTT